MDNEEIESILNCPICMEEYVDPRILPCQHSFCEACLSTYIKDLNKNKVVNVGKFPCPICRNETKLRNNADDASLLEKDLIKITLLQSKHILLDQDEKSSDEGVDKQAIATKTEDGDKDSSSTTLPDGNSYCTSRKLHSKRKRKRTIRKIKTNKGKKNSMKNILQQKQKNTDTKMAPDVANKHDLECIEYLLLYFFIIPIFSRRPTEMNKELFFALFFLLMTIVVTIWIITVDKMSAAYMFVAVILGLPSIEYSCEILSSHVKMAETRQYQKLLFCFLHILIMFSSLFVSLNMFLIVLSFGVSLCNALFTQGSIISMPEIMENFFAFKSTFENFLLKIF